MASGRPPVTDRPFCAGERGMFPRPKGPRRKQPAISRGTRMLAPWEIDVGREIEHVIRCGAAGETHIVALGPLVLFLRPRLRVGPRCRRLAGILPHGRLHTAPVAAAVRDAGAVWACLGGDVRSERGLFLDARGAEGDGASRWPGGRDRAGRRRHPERVRLRAP